MMKKTTTPEVDKRQKKGKGKGEDNFKRVGTVVVHHQETVEIKEKPK